MPLRPRGLRGFTRIPPPPDPSSFAAEASGGGILRSRVRHKKGALGTNRLNQLKKIAAGGEQLSKDELVELKDLEQKLASAGGPTVPPAQPKPL